MKKIIFIIMIGAFFSPAALCDDDKPQDPQKLFYAGNAYYSDMGYAKAVKNYEAILDMGLENGELYYNIGNCYLKMGKIGYAIFFYEKARRLIPQDSDLRSNLEYARTLAGDMSASAQGGGIVLRIVQKPFKGFNLNALFLSAVLMYILLALVMTFSILNPIAAKRLRVVFMLMVVLFLLNSAAFGMRYYDEELLRHGVIVQKDVEAKYEPIDKSTTYYRLPEGSDVFVLATRDGWRQVRRPDGKIAWVKKEAAEEI